MWFYIYDRTSWGPHSLEQLAAALGAVPDPGKILVWRDGFAGWQPAAAVPELIAKLRPSASPPVPEIPAGAPSARVPTFGATLAPELTPAAADEAAFVATQYRTLVLLVGAQMLLGIALQVFAGGSSAAAVVALLLGLVGLGLSVVMAVTVYRLMDALGGVPALWAVGMFVPVLNIVLLLVISARSQAWCRTRGIQVGFLGPTSESIVRLRDGS